MKLAYIRVSPTHPLGPQREALERAGFSERDELAGPIYLDAKPKRGEASWYWRGKLLNAIRHSEGDEVWVAEASVWGSSQADAIEALRQLTAKGGVLCIVSTGERFRWHEDAEGALALAARIAKENAKRSTDAAREQRRQNTRKRKARDARKRAKLKAFWDDHTLTGQEAAERAGVSRSAMIRMFGARGTARFRSPRNE